MQVTIIGGGSYQWGPSLMADLLLTPCFAEGGHLVLEDIDPAPLVKMEALAQRMIDQLGDDGHGGHLHRPAPGSRRGRLRGGHHLDRRVRRR